VANSEWKVFHCFRFVLRLVSHVTLYGVTKRETGASKRETEVEFYFQRYFWLRWCLGFSVAVFSQARMNLLAKAEFGTENGEANV
jgi:hypothetical protein